MNAKTTLQNLLVQQQTVATKLAAARLSLEERQKESVAAADTCSETASRNIRGTATDAQMAQAKINAERAKLAECEARDAVHDIEQQAGAISREIQDAECAVREERYAIAANLAREVEAEIRGDKRLRANLCRLHALWNSSVSGLVDWEASIRDAFPLPSADEMEDAYATASQQMGG